MSKQGKTTVANKLKRERIFINSNGQEIDRKEFGKSKLDGEISKEDEIASLEARLKELKDE